jgi:hypothetical protein
MNNNNKKKSSYLISHKMYFTVKTDFFVSFLSDYIFGKHIEKISFFRLLSKIDFLKNKSRYKRYSLFY